MDETRELIEATIQAHVCFKSRVIDIRRREGGAQGFSGATLHYYDVVYEAPVGERGEVRLVIKEATLVERRTLAWLNGRGLAVPFSHTLDRVGEATAPVCMQFAGDMAPPPEMVAEAASGLAAIHAAAMGRGAELPWLPRADRAYFMGPMVVDAWRQPWEHALRDEAFTSGAGYTWPRSERGADFAAEFDELTAPLEAAAERFVDAMEALWTAEDSLTLIHADFHGDNMRWDGRRVSVIDWGQARYGSLYVDLPNYFTRDQALIYRDALAELGHDIAHDKFLAGYDAAWPYPGFKYFGIGIWNWRYGKPPHQRDAVQHFVDMVLPPV